MNLELAFSAIATVLLLSSTKTEAQVKPAKPEILVRQYFETRLLDPNSAKYKFGRMALIKCQSNDVDLRMPLDSHWAMEVAINAKNAFGGYTGFQIYTVHFVGNAVVADDERLNLDSLKTFEGCVSS